MKYINAYASVNEALTGGGYSPNVSYVQGSLNTDNLVYTNVGDNKEVEFKLDTDGKVKGEEKAEPVVKQPLTFTAEEAGSIVKLVKYGTPDEISLQYSTNGTTWNNYTIGNKITLANVGDKVMFSATDTNQTFSKNESRFYSFTTLGKLASNGNVMSLLDKAMERTDVPQYCFYNLFYGTDLTSAPELPATTLALCCYNSMFGYCKSLTTAPELPATTLAIACYTNMFNMCSSLVTAPELPATTLTEQCYNSMFSYCTSLTDAPSLPDTTIADGCYKYMFKGCTSLTQAPSILPASTLVNSCYYGMFEECTSLTEAPELPATTLARECYTNMFTGCASLTEAPELPATTLADHCYSYMFVGCTSLTEAPELPATELVEGIEGGMDGCYSGMFAGCTSLTTAPELPAAHLTPYCYSEMFGECTNLSSITMLAEDVSAEGCLDNWVFGVAEEGTLRLCTELDLPEGESGIPTGWTVVNV